MARIIVKVTPTNGNDVGWDVYCVRWKADEKALIIHKLTWAGPDDGDFTGTSADLPSDVYGVFAAVNLTGEKVSVVVDGRLHILQRVGGNWPMKVELDGTTTQAADIWYFQT